jgi:hypothetical protein
VRRGPLPWLLVAALSAAACRHAAPPVGSPPPPTPTPAGTAWGAVSLRYLTGGDDAPPQLGPDQRMVAPFPVSRPMPVYPAEAVAAAAPPAVVVVRILVDTDGKIAAVGDSPLASSTPGPYAAAFRQAVEAAVKRWEFYPGHVDTVRPGRDIDGDGNPDDELVQYAPVAVYYDLSFEFRIVAGKPAVTLSPG